MYLLYVLALLLLTWFAPALAIWPGLLSSSRTAVAIPIVSVAVIGLAQATLAGVGAYDVATVRMLALGLAVVAATRIWLWYRAKPTLHWPKTHVTLLGFTLLLGLYWAARLGTTAFDTNDEIYSWNLWAMQHALGEPIDLFYTQAPYPQLFAVLVSWKYQLLGSFELQLPLRATLALIPVVLWGTIAVAPLKTDEATAWRALVVMLLLVAAVGRWFGHGLADPLMAAALIVAIHSYLRYRAAPRRHGLLVLSVVCAGVAMYSKQPALIWGLASFPLLVLLDRWRQRVPSRALLAPLATLSLGLGWIFGAGSGFENNQGVINASQEGRALAGQLVFATRELLLGEPLVLLLLLAATLSVARTRQHRDVALLFLLPALLIWMLFGAYSTRLGIHVVGCAALLLAATGFALPAPRRERSPVPVANWLHAHQRGVAAGLVALLLAASAWQVFKNVERVGPGFSLYEAGHNAIALYFGHDADVVVNETYARSDRLLWVPSNYLYGLYYHRTPMIRPTQRDGDAYEPRQLFDELLRHRPDLLFDAGDIVPFGPASGVFRSLATEHCPDLFEPLASPPNRYGYTLYRMLDNEAREDGCLNRLRESGNAGA